MEETISPNGCGVGRRRFPVDREIVADLLREQRACNLTLVGTVGLVVDAQGAISASTACVVG
jgi:hypothetical protein